VRYFTHVYERTLGPRLSGNRRSILLLGPRQVGKSTLLASLAPDLTVDLSSLETFRQYVSDPGRLERELEAAPASVRTVFIDEVKASRSVNASDTKGLGVFADRAGRVDRSVVVFLGARRQRVNESEAVPLREFLGELPGL
jgi:septin family protein